jgi:hypothetical protein
MGGQLQIRAVFPEGEVEIEQFGSVAAPATNSEAPVDSRQEVAA